MFWELATCFSNRHTSIPLVSAWSDFVGFDLHPPKQRHLAIAHNQTKHLRTACQQNFHARYTKIRPKTTALVCVSGTLSSQLIEQATVMRSACHAQPHKEKTMKTQKGFSMIELMIAVVIVGVLAAIALPSYQSYVVKGNRAAAQAFMVEVANRQKQYQLDARSYALNLATLYNVATDAAAVPPDVLKHYSACCGIVVVAVPPSFTITAIPTSASQSGDGTLTLNSAGVKTPAAKW